MSSAPIAVKILTLNVWRRCRLRLDVFYALRENLSSALTCKDWCESCHSERGNEVLRHGRPLKFFKEESWPAMPQVRRNEHTPLDHRQRRAVDAAGSGARSPLRGRPRRDGAREFRSCDVLSQLQRVMDNPRSLLT